MKITSFEKKKYVAPKTKKTLKDIFWTIIFPIIGMLVIGLGTVKSGLPLFSNSVILNNILITMITVLIACFALNTNLNSGRMDFSIGAVGILACVIAWQILPNKAGEMFPLYFLLTSIALGIVLGLVSGLIFTTLKVPAIVVSLGACLVFEGIANALTLGSGSIEMKPEIAPGLYGFITNPWFMASIVILLCVFMLLTLKYSKFGHDKLSLLFGQKVAVDTGVNEVKNALACYALAGGLIAIFTFITSINLNKINISVNLGSAMTVMANFLPIFLGGLIAKHSNEVVGLLLGVFSVTLFKDGLVRFGVSDSTINLITSILIFVILTYMVNWQNWVNLIKYKIKNYKAKKYELKKEEE